MPYIAVNTSRILTQDQKEAIKTALGAGISLIPGKSEKSLMVDFADGRTMYFAGQSCDTAYVDVKIFGSTTIEAKQAFTKRVDEILRQNGMEQAEIYLTFAEMPGWGVNESYK